MKKILRIIAIVAAATITQACTVADKSADHSTTTDHPAIAADDVTAPAIDTAALAAWTVCATVDSAAVATYCVDRCFSAEAISDSIYNVINGVSYHAECPVGRQELRYLRILHYDIKGDIRIGEMICNQKIADELIDIFRRLYEARYPIERMRLVDNYGGDDELSMTDNNTSCFNCRPIQGGRRMSRHAYGMAIDINPLYNPYIKTGSNNVTIIAPAAGAEYADRSGHEYMIRKGDICYQSFVVKGFKWGGNWSRNVKDYQHFEK